MSGPALPTVLITGATGRVGALLRAAWTARAPLGFYPVWQRRGAGVPGWLSWDILNETCPNLDPDPRIIVNLAGVTPTRHQALTDNLPLAKTVHDAARFFGATHLFLASSAAVYDANTAAILTESLGLRPASAYGVAKGDMERSALSWTRPKTTILRIGNVVGADALLGAASPGQAVSLDPIPGQKHGPQRSWIGPATLAAALENLIVQALSEAELPSILNLAQSPGCFMDEMLDAARIPWHFGPHNPCVIPSVVLSDARLSEVLPAPLPRAEPRRMVAEWRELSGTAP